MDFNDTPDEAAFRAAARDWLARAASDYVQPPAEPWSEDELVARGRAWLAAKAAAGFGGVRWPTDLGGRNGTPMEAVILAEEEARYHLPVAPFATIGMNMAMPAVMKHGTAEQVERFAAHTLRGEFLWCQLFSEPGAGSDLAALRTRAVRDGDRWIVNGQKVWSSWAHRADWGILLVRTDPSLPKHKGLSFFVIDMKTPGVEVRPIRQISGKPEFNEVFLTDVSLPDANRIGAEGEGWAVAMTVLMGERVSSGEEAGGIDALIRLAAQTVIAGDTALDNAAVREKLAGWYANEQGEKYFRFRLLTQLSRGQTPGAEAALVKLVYANRLQQACGFGLEMQGYAGSVTRPGETAQAQLTDDYIWAPAMRIAGGADEVLRNQIAERVLGMPGETRFDKDSPFDQPSRA